jgi:hypothetical protein
MKRYGKVEAVLLQNHGIVLHTHGDPLRLLEQWEEIETSFLSEWDYPNPLTRAQPPSKPITEKLYFPDSAVFLSPLQKALDFYNHASPHGISSLTKGNFGTDENISELAWATALLASVAPNLREIGARIQSQVAGLPTEVYRKGGK